MMKLNFCHYIDSSTLAKLKTSKHKIIVVSIADTIKSKLDTIKSWLKKPKPFYLKIVWGIISAIILIFFAMLINTIYQPQN